MRTKREVQEQLGSFRVEQAHICREQGNPDDVLAAKIDTLEWMLGKAEKEQDRQDLSCRGCVDEKEIMTDECASCRRIYPNEKEDQYRKKEGKMP